MITLSEVPVRPSLAPGVRLAGEMRDTGFEEKQWLAIRNGTFIQLGELLYRVAELSDGKRSFDDIAERMTESSQWVVTAEHVRTILSKMMPLGIIATEGGASPLHQTPPAAPAAQMLGISMRTQVIGPRIIQPIAGILQVFFRPFVLVPLLVAVAMAHLWVYLEHGISQSFMDLLYRPWGFPIVLCLMIVSGVFHEFGHAAALVYGGGQVRGMGAGLYLVYPAFYTDLTDSYLLDRKARVRTDLGGFYFYLLFALGIIGLYFLTGLEFLLLIVFLINLDILYQCLPFVRLDGYYVMADLTGIPDPITYMKPFLESLVIAPERTPRKLPPLKPHVRRIFLAYTLLTVPLLLAGVILMVFALPSFVIRFYDSIAYQLQVIPVAWRNGDLPGVVVLSFAVLLLATMTIGSLYIFLRMARAFISGLWTWSKGNVRRRLSGAALATAAVFAVGHSWSPSFQILFNVAPQNVRTFQVAGGDETQHAVEYEQTPPVGGDHATNWQNCGFYDVPIVSETAVHSLKRGAVWVTYQPTLPAKQIAALRRLAYRQAYVLVSPYQDLPAPVVASAWGRQLYLESANDSALEQFIRAYRLSDLASERGATCTDGVGSPK